MENKDKISIKSFEIISAITIIFVTILFVSITFFTDKNLPLKIIKIKNNLLYYQIITFLMLPSIFIFYLIGKKFGKIVNDKISYNKKHLQTMDFNFSILMILIFIITVAHINLNWGIYKFIFSRSVEEGYIIIYYFSFKIITLLILQIGLCIIAIIAFYHRYIWELRNKESDRRPYRVRDIYCELFGKKARYIEKLDDDLWVIK